MAIRIVLSWKFVSPLLSRAVVVDMIEVGRTALDDGPGVVIAFPSGAMKDAPSAVAGPFCTKEMVGEPFAAKNELSGSKPRRCQGLCDGSRCESGKRRETTEETGGSQPQLQVKEVRGGGKGDAQGGRWPVLCRNGDQARHGNITQTRSGRDGEIESLLEVVLDGREEGQNELP